MTQPLDFAYELGNPDGYTISVRPGWSLYIPEDEGAEARALRGVLVGALYVPHIFEAYVRSETDDFVVVLMFLADVRSGEIHMAAALSPYIDTDKALKRIFAVRPRKWWTQNAYLSLAFWDGSDDAAAEQEYWRPDMIVDAMDRHPSSTILDRVREAKRNSPVRTRQRMTDSFLAEVANVYRTALEGGEHPTRAVATYFDKPYSTAGRWVGEARRRNILEPADLLSDLAEGRQEQDTARSDT